MAGPVAPEFVRAVTTGQFWIFFFDPIAPRYEPSARAMVLSGYNALAATGPDVRPPSPGCRTLPCCTSAARGPCQSGLERPQLAASLL